MIAFKKTKSKWVTEKEDTSLQSDKELEGDF